MANLSGTSGNDSLVGTAGDDTLDVRAASAGVTVNFADGTVGAGTLWAAAARTGDRGLDLKRVCLPAQLQLVAWLKNQGPDARTPADVQPLAGDNAVLQVGEEEHRPRQVAGLA